MFLIYQLNWPSLVHLSISTAAVICLYFIKNHIVLFKTSILFRLFSSSGHKDPYKPSNTLYLKALHSGTFQKSPCRDTSWCIFSTPGLSFRETRFIFQRSQIKFHRAGAEHGRKIKQTNKQTNTTENKLFASEMLPV